MADQKGTMVTGIRLGKAFFEIAEPSFLADVLKDNKIDVGNGTLTVDGKTYPASAAASIPVSPSTQSIRVNPPAKGGR